VSKQGLYAVRISGLVEGDHDFAFELDQKFFALFEHSEIEEGNVMAKVLLEKKTGLFALHFTLTGEVEVICDRCLDSYSAPISSLQTVFVKTGSTPGEIEDDVLMIGRDDHEIDVGSYMYEFIILALPYKRIHPSDKDGNSLCNPEMLKRLDAHSIIESKEEEKTDPRWDVLKGIIEKNK